ncbi:carboxymuconolactone decarboxylase family protein [Rhodovastum atsumiense]|uniref:Carboxymuconolactone decarboxylase family protein n=1 Tax=Rhodovastum atsumiense TaxID=504468 RepID=A0A5M6IMJ5_9PROT|nr:carboxymuconolactone decarboxylase family protein [Rhodovastum atsumiense]KAA5609503.1 carboxymuconolactone decarboxylase family protein [Rhodovastum atsumiense]
MARIDYAPIDRPEDTRLVAQISAQRGGVLHLYRMLLHSPPVAHGWLHYLTALREGCRLPGALREMVILRVAMLNRVGYEAEHHIPLARAEGVTAAQLEGLADWRNSDLFDARERVVLALTDAMTREVQVAEDVFVAVRAEFDERTLVELVATIAAYNMVSRFVEAFRIDRRDPV